MHVRCREVVNFFALYGPNPRFRFSAAYCSPDDAVLKRIALEERENGAAICVFRRIRHHDAATLRKFSRYSWNPRLRQMALNKLEHFQDDEPILPENQHKPYVKEGVSFARYLADCNAAKLRYDANSVSLRECLLSSGADEQELLFGYARGGTFAPKYFDGKESLPDEGMRVLAASNPNLTNTQHLLALTLLGGAVGLAAYARGADILDANEILLRTNDDGVALAAVERANDSQTLRAFADDTEKPYFARMKAYGKLGDLENLRRYAARPEKYHRSNWRYGYFMNSSNFAAVSACTDKETLLNLYGYAVSDHVSFWAIRIASPEEDRQKFIPQKRGTVPKENLGRISPVDLAYCRAVCRSLDTAEITNALRAIATRRDMLFYCAVEGMAFCRGRAAHLLASLPDTQEELRFIAENEGNPYVVKKATDGIRWRTP